MPLLPQKAQLLMPLLPLKALLLMPLPPLTALLLPRATLSMLLPRR